MKMNKLTVFAAAALLVAGAATALLAQTPTTPVCPFGHAPGYGRTLTPEQRAAHQAVAQQLVAELKAKREAGKATAEELAWLERVEQRGGMCINGVPRGPGVGKGQGPGQGAGFGHRRGLRDGTGPRCANGGCPQATPAPAK